MHRTRLAKRFFAAAMALTMTLSMVFNGSVQVAAAENSDDVNKEEVVYVITDSDGEINDIIVSDKLKNKGGSSELFDSSDLDDIENVKGDEQYTKDGNDKITWSADGNDISYQGKSTKDLPVDVKLSFKLDGRPMSAKELAGKSGKVTIRFDYTNNEKRKVNTNGKDYEVYVPFTVVSGMILDSEKFSNVEVENGKAITEGGNTIVFGYAMPGLKDSLGLGKEIFEDQDDIDLPDYIEMTADVKDFELGMTMTAVTNDLLNSLNTDDVDTDDVEESIDDLEEATDKLVDGSNELNKGVGTAYQGSKTLAKNMGTMATGTKSLQQAIGKYTNGVDVLYKKVPTLTSGVKTLNTGASDLAVGATDLKNGTLTYVSGVDSLANGLLGDGTEKNPGYLKGVEALSAGAKQLSGLSKLDQVYGAISIMKDATSTDATYTDADGNKSVTLGAGNAAVVDGIDQIIGQVEASNSGLAGDNLKKIGGALSQAGGILQSATGKVNTAATAVGEAKTVVGDAAAEAKNQAGHVEEAKKQLTSEKEAIDQEIAVKNDKIGEKNTKIKEAQEKANDNINDSINAAIEELKEAKSDLESTREALEGAKKTLKEAETDEQKFDDKIGKLDNRIDAIKGKIGSIESEISTLEGKKSPVEVTENAVDSFEKVSVSVDVTEISSEQLENHANTLAGNNISSINFNQEMAIGQIGQGIFVAADSMGSDPFGDLIKGLKQVKGGAEQISGGINALHSNLDTLKTSTSSFPAAAEGITALNKGFDTLTKNNGTIRTGATLLKKNGPVLSSGVKQVAYGAQKISKGTSTLNKGAKTLGKGVKTLASNNADLNKGAKTIAQGAKLLSDGSGTLEKGMNKLLEGSETLKDGMEKYKEEGIQEIVDLYDKDIVGLEDRFDAVKEAGKGYQTYSKLAEGQKGNVKFIYKSEEIKNEE